MYSSHILWTTAGVTDRRHNKRSTTEIHHHRRRPTTITTTAMVLSILLCSTTGSNAAAPFVSRHISPFLRTTIKSTSSSSSSSAAAFVRSRTTTTSKSSSQNVHQSYSSLPNTLHLPPRIRTIYSTLSSSSSPFRPIRIGGGVVWERYMSTSASTTGDIPTTAVTTNDHDESSTKKKDLVTTTTTTIGGNTKGYDILNRERGLCDKYDPSSFENDIYTWWEQSGCFQPDAQNLNRKSSNSVVGPTSETTTIATTSTTGKEKPPYVLPMPPPNVTGRLHMGHAIFVALQDVLARFHRMRGRPVLWLPGTDHAGIATQLQVEKILLTEGTTRETVGRTEFLRRVWEYKQEQGGAITQQLRSLGASADWSRERFTMDHELSEAVVEAFVRLHEKGLIYRGEYMVNWAPMLKTAVSDLEVEYFDELGKLYYFKYMIQDSEGRIYVLEQALGKNAL
jgi:tRNA synthetases class I (I, L, M and V)